MTRILSELLQATEPHFRLQLRQLEEASGRNSTDIRLSTEIVQSAKHKIHQLGLDRHDTTTEELYHVLLERVTADDRRLERALRTRAATHVSAEANLMAGMAHALQQEANATASFSIKAAALKRLLKKNAPKRVAKSLGYRSLDAMLRGEVPAAIVAAALLTESAAWRRSWTDAYKQLKPSDFESRTALIVHPKDKRWHSLATKISTEQAHTVIGLPEVGAVILLPLPQNHPSGMVIASMALALHELNDIAAAGNYLRASQVHGDFGGRVQAVAGGKVQLVTPMLHQAVSWKLVQQYFAKTKSVVSEDIFGPYVQATDFAWHDVEAKLTKLCPALEFWEGTSYLSFLHEGHNVSMNIIDSAINACNGLSYEARGIVHAQQALWNELTLRYLNHDSVEQAVASVLQPKQALEMATN